MDEQELPGAEPPGAESPPADSPPTNNQPGKPTRPRLLVSKRRSPPAPALPADSPAPPTDSPPPAFGGPSPEEHGSDSPPSAQRSQSPLVVPPLSVGGRRRVVAGGGSGGGLGPEWLVEPYRRLCPPGLRGEELMKWYLAVQTGERLTLERAQTLEGVSAQLGDQGELLGDIVRLIESLGRGLAQVVDLVQQGAGSPPPIRPLPPPPPRRAPSLPPAPEPAAFVEDSPDAPFVPAPQVAAGALAGQVTLSRPPSLPSRLTNRDADRVREYARSLVPITGIPWAMDQQIALAAEIAEQALAEWAGPGKSAPSRWPDYIRAAIIDRLGIDRAVGDPQ